jgi:hypothetical protein
MTSPPAEFPDMQGLFDITAQLRWEAFNPDTGGHAEWRPLDARHNDEDVGQRRLDADRQITKWGSGH